MKGEGTTGTGKLGDTDEIIAELRGETGVSKSRYFGISIPIKYSNFSRFYKKNGSIL